MPQKIAQREAHYALDDNIFTIIGSRPPSNFPRNIPSPIPLQLLCSNQSYDFLACPNWITPRTPYIGFLPAMDVFRQFWLRPLRYSSDTEIERLSNGKFILGRAVRKAWDMQERNMRKLLVSAAQNTLDLALPYPYTPWPFPRQYGYTKSHASREDVHRQARAAHKAFLPLIASINFHIRIMIHQMQRMTTAHGRTLERHEWLHVLKNHSGITGTWMNYWMDTILEGPVLGGYVDLCTFSCPEFLPVFEAAGMPLVVCWGKNPEDISLACGKEWPPDKQLSRLLLREQQPYNAEETPEPPTSDKVEAGAGVRPKETMAEFFRRRLEQRERCLKIETPIQKQSRESRETHSFEGAVPGNNGARVYEWELDDGCYIRKQVDRNAVEDAWEFYGVHQRRYDSVADEWDCSFTFGNLTPEDDQANHDNKQALVQMFPDDDPPVDAQHDSTVYIGSLHAPTVQIHEPVYFDDTVEDVAHYRLGFVDPSEMTELHTDMPWEKVERMLGFGGPSTPKAALISQKTKGSISRFLMQLMEAKELSDGPPALDLRDPHANVHTDLPFPVQFLNVGDGFYLLQENLHKVQSPAPFILALSSGGTVLEIIRRQWGPGLEIVVERLMQAGIPFRTFIQSHRQLYPHNPEPPPADRKSNIGMEGSIDARVKLGYRDHDHKFDLQDYKVYVRERDAFLSTYRGRAAIMMGGIVARLARDAVNPKDVLDGPTPDVDKEWGKGECFTPGEGMKVYWDDVLTEEEINLVCGVYDVAKGPPNEKGNIVLCQKSWWPKPAAWQSSGLNCGYWSRDAEAWYQTRVDLIWKGQEVKLLTKQDWRGNVKFTRDAVRLKERYDRLAREFLDNQFFE
ncbi:hypothetical protein V5O48_018129 [Marasmius crinis-equi]|uniref:Uncharacterized protein n=1 Tax=Marasmius crinis-equi TaxID=585013 RepID=A0ABR3EM20_9AGAR